LIRLLIPLFLSIVTAGLIGTTNAASSDYTIFPTNSTLNGVPYKDLIAKFWIWSDSIPNDMHPLKKYPDAARCSAMQEGPVWFLPNALPKEAEKEGVYNFQCNVPFGKVIMVPVSMTDCESGATEDIMDDNALKECAFNVKTTSDLIEVSIDGEKVNTTKLGNPIDSDFFNVTYPSNPLDVFGSVKPGTYRAIAEGLALFIHDLPVGTHNIHYKVTDLLKGKEFEGSIGETSEANYEISVQ
jgi:hypothetical protein